MQSYFDSGTPDKKKERQIGIVLLIKPLNIRRLDLIPLYSKLDSTS